MSLCNSSYNMAAPLSTCTVEEQQNAIRFLWSESVKPSEMYRRMKVQHGDSCLSEGRVCEWVERFQNGRKNVSDEHRIARTVAWQLRQWNSRSSRESVTTGETLLMKLPYNSTWVMALRIVLSMMTSGIGKCVADGSQSSCPMITCVHGRRFVRSIWTVMLVKEMLFSIELWQETSPGCTIMNKRVRGNRCSASTRLFRPARNSRHRLPLGKSSW